MPLPADAGVLLLSPEIRDAFGRLVCSLDSPDTQPRRQRMLAPSVKSKLDLPVSVGHREIRGMEGLQR